MVRASSQLQRFISQDRRQVLSKSACGQELADKARADIRVPKMSISVIVHDVGHVDDGPMKMETRSLDRIRDCDRIQPQTCFMARVEDE